jgi:hypothetical protein
MIILAVCIGSLCAREAVASLPALTMEPAPEVFSTFPDSASQLLATSPEPASVNLETHTTTPPLRIPEPATLSLFFTAFSAIVG